LIPRNTINRLDSRSNRGFTVLELMVTLAVAGVLVTVGVPGFTEIVRNNRVTAQTNELVTAINLARSEAIKRGRNVAVAVTESGNGWAATVTVAGIVEPLRVVERPASNVTLMDDVTVTFGANGAPAGAATFDLQPYSNCTGTQRRRVQVTAAGQVVTTREACA
jgi:type IV fimbrial biogenesis protein FimT